ncbi:hypothetical protein C4E04_13165 [Microvirga sp. 17 mud 1-3]|nr:hypothetical protein C4E04_13165 [Microvirga sp. 17 mud 1-3]
MLAESAAIMLQVRDQLATIRTSTDEAKIKLSSADDLQGILNDLQRIRETYTQRQTGLEKAEHYINNIKGEINRRLDVISSEITRRDATVTPVTGLSWIDLHGQQIKILETPLRFDIDVLKVASLRHPKGLKYDPSKLPVPWPKQYVEQFKQEFNPYTFASNCSAVAQQIREGNGDWIQQITYLLTQLAKYTNAQDEIFYNFDYQQVGDIFKAGWKSALGNALVSVGLLEIYDATKDDKYLNLSRRYLAPLTTAWQDEDIVRLDQANYLWFEETPPANGRPISVYNGHVYTTLALYRYQQLTGDKSLEPYLRAGLATAARYLPESRRPGKIPVYSRYDETPDYGPLRAYNQANALWEITGNRIFKDLADGLMTDIPVR